MPAQSNPAPLAPQQQATAYPSLNQGNDPRESNLPYPLHPTAAIVPANVYPELGGYMGLEFNEQTIRDNMPEYLAGQQVAIPPPVSFLTTILSNFYFNDMMFSKFRCEMNSRPFYMGSIIGHLL